MRFLFTCVAAAWTLACCLQATAADDVSVLRLVPFPKEVQRRAGTFPLRRNLSLELPADVAGQLGRLIAAELQLRGPAGPARSTRRWQPSGVALGSAARSTLHAD